MSVVLAVGFANFTSAEDSSDPPVPLNPTIVGFTVEVYQDSEGVIFRFSGRIESCEYIASPTIEIVGTPFDTTVYPTGSGQFAVEFGFSGEVGVGTIVSAYVSDNGTRVSDIVHINT
jgi:hypothetical protein